MASDPDMQRLFAELTGEGALKTKTPHPILFYARADGSEARDFLISDLLEH